MQSVGDFQALIRNDLQSGVIDLETALVTKFHYVFAQENLPECYRVSAFSPLRCGTDLVREYLDAREHLSPESRATIEAYLAWSPGRAVYLSAGSHFRLYYDTAGADAVPAIDVDPANGVPDFVEKIADYLEQAWLIQFDTLGFLTPSLTGSRLDVSFADMTAYGYTTIVNAEQGRCRIVLHNDFEGFPLNDDPDGPVWGAAKVTAAHELKHTSQYLGSRWSENEWIELDAVWVEELVFDQVNDYYNFLLGESPIVRPDIPLVGLDGAGGSYEDSVYQLWLSQTWGPGIVRDFWIWRITHRTQPVMESWQQMLAVRGTNLAQVWPMFGAWNYGTGYRAVSGLGYEEAAGYPHGLAAVAVDSYPFSHTGQVNYLANEFINLNDLSVGNAAPSEARIEFYGDSGAELTLAAHIRRFDGTGNIEIIELDENNRADHVLSVPLDEVDVVGLVVGNAGLIAGTAAYDVTVTKQTDLPDPVVSVTPAAVTVDVDHGETTEIYFTISNTGPVGSTLEFNMRLQNKAPDGATDKSVAGSTLASTTSDFQPGTTQTLTVTVTNGSNDDEWLTDVTLSLPAGVTVVNLTDFVGGSLGDLVANWTRTGEQAAAARRKPAVGRENGRRDHEILHWHGTYGSQGYGVIRDGESATATISLAFAAGLSGSLQLPWSVSGDEFGANPHTVYGNLLLTANSPEISVWSPTDGDALAIGEDLDIAWTTFGTIDAVNIDLSRNGGESWEPVAGEIPDSGFHTTQVHGPSADDCLVRVSAAAGDAVGLSTGGFVIYEALSWASCDTDSGRVAGGDVAQFRVRFSSQGLTDGTYLGYAVIDHNDASTPTVVPLRLRVGLVSPVPSPVGGFELLDNFPNPFNPRTVIQLRLASAADVAVDVLDVRGRRLKKLHRGDLPAGTHSLVWIGRDDMGRKLASGSYLVRVRAAGQTLTRKMTLAR